jgi:hypothetical protein
MQTSTGGKCTGTLAGTVLIDRSPTARKLRTLVKHSPQRGCASSQAAELRRRGTPEAVVRRPLARNDRFRAAPSPDHAEAVLRRVALS